MTLDKLRATLTEVDDQLMELVAKRQRIVEQISRHKLDSGTATRDYQREKRVVDGARRRANALGLPPALAEDIMRLLIDSSLTRQEKARVVAEGGGSGRRALVIGGAGQMGNWFADFLASQGYDVAIADPAAAAQSRYPQVAADLNEPLDHDVILIAAPLGATKVILAQLAKIKPAGLIVDIGSLKSPLRAQLETLAGAGCQVASIHPMFGPDTRLLSGRHVIFVDVGVPQATAMARQLFASTLAEQYEMGLDEHDRLIAYVLGLSHALNVSFFTALADSGELVPRLARMSSTTFDAQLGVAALVARDNPHLYYEIQALNEFGGDALDALAAASARVRDLIKSNDEAGFVQLMEAGRQYMAQHDDNG